MRMAAAVHADGDGTDGIDERAVVNLGVLMLQPVTLWESQGPCLKIEVLLCYSLGDVGMQWVM